MAKKKNGDSDKEQNTTNTKVDESLENENISDSESESSKEDEIETDDDKSDEIQKELDTVKEQLLRITAEYSNFRKRSEKEKSESYSHGEAKTVEEFLPMFDNLERALASEQQDYDSLKKGVQMTFDGLMSTLEKIGVTVFGEAGETFDPNLHHAVMHIEDENLEENVITDVFQKGYKLNDKIIRPAMVKTAN